MVLRISRPIIAHFIGSPFPLMPDIFRPFAIIDVTALPMPLQDFRQKSPTPPVIFPARCLSPAVYFEPLSAPDAISPTPAIFVFIDVFVAFIIAAISPGSA